MHWCGSYWSSSWKLMLNGPPELRQGNKSKSAAFVARLLFSRQYDHMSYDDTLQSIALVRLIFSRQCSALPPSAVQSTSVQLASRWLHPPQKLHIFQIFPGCQYHLFGLRIWPCGEHFSSINMAFNHVRCIWTKLYIAIEGFMCSQIIK